MMINPFALENKTILITGASSGIGAATAILCSKMGANVIITARNEERLKSVFSLLEGKNNQMIVADLSLNEDIDNLVSLLPEIDGIVHNAGIVKTAPVKFLIENDFQEIMQTNFFAPALLSKKILKIKKIKKNSSIVFISSLATSIAEVGNSMYSASKGALNSFSKVLALELAPQKIRVNCIQPAMVETNLLKENLITEEQLKEDLKRYPLGRYGKPEDVANLIVFLLSGASEWMTGSIINIDGGISLR